jgi:phosphotransferase system HPr (HPr) family protein
MKVLQTEVVVGWEWGLHMRPATRIVQTARQYQADVTIKNETRHADGKSLMQLLTLGACCDTRLTLQVEGPDARVLTEAIARIFKEASPFQAASVHSL